MKKGLLKKLIAASLAAVFVLAAAGCAAAPAAAPAPAAEAPAAEAPAAEPEAEEGAEEAAAPEELVPIKWIMIGNGMPDNYDAWIKQLNDYIGPKIGVEAEVEIIPWGDFDNRRNVLVSTGGDYDILWCAGSQHSFVEMGAFMPITDLLPECVPDLYNYIPADFWDAVKINGEIYTIPVYKDSAATHYQVWDQDLCDAAGVDPTQFTDLTEDMTEALLKLKDAETENHIAGEAPCIIDSGGAGYLLSRYDMMNSGQSVLGVRYDDPEAKVVYVFEQEDILNYLKLYREWYELGIINSDAATLPGNAVSNYTGWQVSQGWSTAAITVWGPNRGCNCTAVQWGDTILSNGTVQGSMEAISANCARPDKALEFIQITNLDSYVRDLFYYGVEGENWEYTESGKVHKLNESWPMAGYTQATFFTVTPLDDVEINQWDEVKELNEQAIPSVTLGFNVDVSPVLDDISNLAAIYNSYKSELMTGTVDPEETIASMTEELEAAGLEKVREELQRQLDEFLGK